MTQLHTPRFRTLWYLVGCAGLLARVGLWWVSEGTNDIRTFGRFAQLIDAHGLGGTYLRDPLFNHPPLMGLWAQAALHLAPQLGLTFARCFKLLGMIADLGSALLLVAIWRRRALPDHAARAFAAYACSLVAILISGYHGNTDCAYWFLVLAAVYLQQDRRAPFWSGLVLGAALNVKLIPVLVVLPLAAGLRSLRALIRYGVGLGVALAPFVWFVISLGPEEQAAFVQNVFGYTSYQEYWGIELLVKAITAAFRISAPAIMTAASDLEWLYAAQGARVLLLVTTILALWQALARHPGLDAYAMAALSFCLFLVLASGFGIQYLGVVVPLLMARDIRDGFNVATMAGIFIGLIYASFVQTWTPIFSQHTYFSASFSAPSLITWWLLVRSCQHIWRARRTPPGYLRPDSPA
jgi:hypothetical protein